MNTQTLIRDLTCSDPARRLHSARILGMLDEVEALMPLTRAYKCETDANVRSVMAWAGKRLQAAKANGYNTFEELWRCFCIQREIDGDKTTPSTDEPYVGLSQHELEMIREQVKAESRLQKIQGRYALLGGITGNPLIPLSKALQENPLDKQPKHLSPVHIDRHKDVKRRIMPTEPSTIELRPHIKRLLHDHDADIRRKAAITLGDLNNPAALPALAQAFANDSVLEVQTTAQYYGKRLYWNLIYWEMERDGTMTQELKRRKALMGQTTEEEKPKTESREAIENLLRRGHEKRRKR